MCPWTWNQREFWILYKSHIRSCETLNSVSQGILFCCWNLNSQGNVHHRKLWTLLVYHLLCIMHLLCIVHSMLSPVTREHYLARCLILQHLTVTVRSSVVKTVLFRDPHDHSYFCTGMHISWGFSNEEWFSRRTTYSLISSFLYF